MIEAESLPRWLPDACCPGIVLCMSDDQQTPSEDAAARRPPTPRPGYEFVPMPEAELRLDASADAIRKRINRGTERGWKPGKGPSSMWFVEVPILPGAEATPPPPPPPAPTEGPDIPSATPDMAAASTAEPTAPPDLSGELAATQQLVTELRQRLVERDQDVEDWKAQARHWQSESDSWREAFTRQQSHMLEIADAQRLELAAGGDTPASSEESDTDEPRPGFWARLGRWFAAG